MSDRGGRVPGFNDASDYRRMRDVLIRANYSDEGLRTLLGIDDLLVMQEFDFPPALRRARSDTALNTLARLLFLGTPVDVDAARRAVHPISLDSWVGANLLELRDNEVIPVVKLLPYRDLLLAADIPAKIRSGAPDDFVLGLGKSSALLAQTVVPRRARKTLDLGSGCGVLAFLASPHSDRVYATDKNPRAAAFGDFNARLNGIDNVEWLTGELFEPVADHRFDLIISNPPYVIAPTARYLFRDSGVRGDEFCRRIVQTAASFLEEGGYCQLLINWAHRANQAWDEPLANWFEGTGCDVVVWAAGTEDASSYAITWIRQTEANYRDHLPQLYDTWMNYYEHEGIEAVTYGLITMRRSSGHAKWVRSTKVATGSNAPGGAHVLRLFQLQDFLASTADYQLLDHRFRLAPEVRLEQRYMPDAGGFSATRTRLHLTAEPSYVMTEIDATVTRLVMCFHGERQLREVLDEMATGMQVEGDDLVAGGLRAARYLVQKGYLLPSSVPDR